MRKIVLICFVATSRSNSLIVTIIISIAKNITFFVCEEGGKIVGFEVLKNVSLPSTLFSVERNYLLIEEIGVDEHFRRGGVETKLIDFAKDFAQRLNLHRIQLDMWAFNDGAEVFYLKQGFDIFRKYMEIKL